MEISVVSQAPRSYDMEFQAIYCPLHQILTDYT